MRVFPKSVLVSLFGAYLSVCFWLLNLLIEIFAGFRGANKTYRLAHNVGEHMQHHGEATKERFASANHKEGVAGFLRVSAW